MAAITVMLHCYIVKIGDINSSSSSSRGGGGGYDDDDIIYEEEEEIRMMIFRMMTTMMTRDSNGLKYLPFFLPFLPFLHGIPW